jgi:hypothetical protein
MKALPRPSEFPPLWHIIGLLVSKTAAAATMWASVDAEAENKKTTAPLLRNKPACNAFVCGEKPAATRLRQPAAGVVEKAAYKQVLERPALDSTCSAASSVSSSSSPSGAPVTVSHISGPPPLPPPSFDDINDSNRR